MGCTQVLTCSAHTGAGVPALLRALDEFRDALAASGEAHALRSRQVRGENL